MNDGDWVESCTALVENFDGTFEIITWEEIEDVHPSSITSGSSIGD